MVECQTQCLFHRRDLFVFERTRRIIFLKTLRAHHAAYNTTGTVLCIYACALQPPCHKISTRYYESEDRPCRTKINTSSGPLRVTHWDPVNNVPELWRRKFNSPCRFKSDRGAAKSEIDAVPAPAQTASSTKRL